MEYAPALILRKRSAKGLTETLKRIKEQIDTGEAIPGEFADLAEIRPNGNREPSDEPQEPNVALDGEVFFPKPSNDEQRRIVDMIRAASGVLVQGPPGTGKSHTIANLICHLLATGQRTLITAKTPRALQVLEGLVPEELRPLCINLLGSGLEERRSLESSVSGILRKNEEWNESYAERQRKESEERLRNLREEQATVNRQLRDIRESETRTHTIAGGAYRGTAARIAESVNHNQARFAWLTDAIHHNHTCPISQDDMRVALTRLRQLPPERKGELQLRWPGNLPSPEQFARLVKTESDAANEEQACVRGASDTLTSVLTTCEPVLIESLAQACTVFQTARKRLLARPIPWLQNALHDILSGNPSLWKAVHHSTSTILTTVDPLLPDADSTRVEFPPDVDARVLSHDARLLREHLENGGKIGWGAFRSKTVRERMYILKVVKVGGRRCSTYEQIARLANAMIVRVGIDEAWDLWKGQVERTAGSFAIQLTALRSLCTTLEEALALTELVEHCRERLGDCSGLSEPDWARIDEVEEVISSCRLALARIRRRQATHDIEHVETQVSFLAYTSSAHPVTDRMLEAIQKRESVNFAQCATEFEHLEADRKNLNELNRLLTKMRKVLPNLTQSLEQSYTDSDWENRIASFGQAWEWAQAKHWIEYYIKQEIVPDLSRRARQLEEEISRILATLAALHAWSYCFLRLKEEHRRHMEAWQQSMRRLGKGTGKHAPRHRRDAQRHLNECREAVPAWVMPLHRVWDTVYPAPGMFDVIIVDEASQCGVEALPLFYLGKKILIVGDDKQISPDAVGLPRDAVHRLMAEFLHDFQFKDSFDVENSLFDHGKLRFGTRRITLREHFRCMPEIIRFSNDLCYSDTPLIPLRQYGPNRLPPLEHVSLSGGYREGSNNRIVNRPEAEAIVERIAEMCGDSRYDAKTMGVVVLQGEAQATLIENQLLERLGAEEMERRRLVCGNPYSFQGDERDIMFLSLVAARNERIGPLTKAADERRFNVAASRARDMMILFHSVTCDDLSASCLRRQLLDFFQNTKPQQIAGIIRDELERRAAQDNRRVVSPPTPFESWFEVDVALDLLRRNFTVLAQYEVGGKRIDLVVEGGIARLAVECDGDHWHGADRYEDDMQRQRQLERCGWQFFRVSEAAFYANREYALAGLWQALEERGIFPHLQSSSDTQERGIHSPSATVPQSTSVNNSHIVDTGSTSFTRDADSFMGQSAADDQDAISEDPFPDNEVGTEARTQSQATDGLDLATPVLFPGTGQAHLYQSNGATDHAAERTVTVGSTVHYTVNGSNETHCVTISSGESDPDRGIINDKTPVAIALMGARVGHTVIAETPSGIRVMKVVAIDP